jgi:hypothetical protein
MIGSWVNRISSQQGRRSQFGRRLVYVCVDDCAYTVADLQERLALQDVDFLALPWETIAATRELPRGGYVLTDFDRLSPSEQDFAACIHERLVAAKQPVLNDPRRFRPRDAMLRHLYRHGINKFSCWRPADGAVPDRYPVFLRTIAAHRGVIGDLLYGPEAAAEGLAAALEAGYALRDLIFVEYAAEALPDSGTFQKHAAFRIGSAVFRANTVHEAAWVVKTGTLGVARPEDYARERAEMDDWPLEGWARQVFDVAEIDFGRIDFALVGGEPQVYEINTNPDIRSKLEHPSAMRIETLTLMRARQDAALAAVAASSSGAPLDVSDLARRGRLYRDRLRRT